MDVAGLLRTCPGSYARRIGEPPALLAVGTATWRGRPPAAWDGRRYVGDGHGLSLVLRGHGTIAGRDGAPHDLAPGLAIHHLPGRAACGVLAGPAAELWVAFGRGLAARLAPLGLLRRDPVLRVGLDPGLLTAFADLHAAMRSPALPGDGPRLLARALHWLQEAYARCDAGTASAGWDERIARACDLLLLDAGRRPDLPALAQSLGTTPLMLRRRFSRRLGLTPLAWWRRQRLHRAGDLLATRSVAEVAGQLGYSDPSALAKQMRRRLGRTPRSYRQAT
ncbi:MAG: helix-turn-helix transcriptional regulator [Planctomycetes bacterium]|nr:helix-turn-helix transcriptional regulator [Planctomycetota bacterium]